MTNFFVASDFASKHVTNKLAPNPTTIDTVYRTLDRVIYCRNANTGNVIVTTPIRGKNRNEQTNANVPLINPYVVHPCEHMINICNQLNVTQ